MVKAAIKLVNNANDLILGNKKYFFKKKMWYYSKNNEIRRDDACIDYASGMKGLKEPDKIITYPCHGEKGNQEWIYNDVISYLFF